MSYATLVNIRTTSLSVSWEKLKGSAVESNISADNDISLVVLFK